MTAFREVRGEGDKLVARLEYYWDSEPESPTAFDQFLARLAGFSGTEALAYGTVILDSTTGACLTALNAQRYRWNPKTKEPRLWYAAVKDQIKNLLAQRLASLPCNFGVVSHTSQEKDELHGTFVRTPNLPGTLKTEAGYAMAEYYHMTIQEGRRVLQTQISPLWASSTQINAPNPSSPTYDAIWKNWIASGREPYPTTCMVYGDPGAGKSTFLATWPKPLLVFLFDPMPKGTPYMMLGKSSPLQTTAA